MPSSLSLDGLRFMLVSSTATPVDPEDSTTFHYHQDGKLVWGEYQGATVSEGRFVGAVHDDRVRISFAHALVDSGAIVQGDAVSRAERADDGRLRLVEDFAVDGVDHVSVCVQL
ncbi:hypothetical protein [Microbacterium sp.]|uniref:hypothetical protein n=1 Tax=Microbacterium sp. TaxID=51671 RepID=UPI0039E62672